ncbi:MAG: hypothetical protein Q7S57_06195 [bacterium]|nr:hypothetical protein [bacterium]
MHKNLFALFLIIIGTIVFARPGLTANPPPTGPINVERDLSNPSIREGIGRENAGYKQDVDPALGLLPATYSWYSEISGGLGSLFKFSNPKWLGIKSGSTNSITGQKTAIQQFFEGIKKIGGKNVTDQAQLGEVCGKKPGDAYWVAYWRPGNIEYAQQYQTWHNQFDCYCRCGEQIDCPIPDYVGYDLWSVIGGGPSTQKVACEVCFGQDAHIRKHDYYVGKDTTDADFSGYPVSDPSNDGYQECLRQSVESYAASGPGGSPNDPTLFGF